MNWLKDRPGLQILFNALITLIGLMFMYYLARGNNRNDEESRQVKQELSKLQTEKATHGYVDSKYNDHFAYDLLQDKKIDSKADKSLVESMDKKLDLILRKLD